RVPAARAHERAHAGRVPPAHGRQQLLLRAPRLRASPGGGEFHRGQGQTVAWAP
ncbi:unnamed protein product, partial [Heterosigma akashiwo]